VALHARASFVIPPAIKAAIDAWATEAKPAGAFVSAVLRNDLRTAVATAEPASLAALGEIVRYVYHHCPGICWGSTRAVSEWPKAHADLVARGLDPAPEIER
jgi:hypothetical protein